MQLEERIQNLILIDHFLVLVDEEEQEITTTGGIVLPGSKKTPNYGTVLRAPTTLIIKEGTTGYAALQLIQPGDTVFFPTNVSVNYIEFSDLPTGKKLILLNKEYIQAFVKKSGDNQ